MQKRSREEMNRLRMQNSSAPIPGNNIILEQISESEVKPAETVEQPKPKKETKSESNIVYKRMPQWHSKIDESLYQYVTMKSRFEEKTKVAYISDLIQKYNKNQDKLNQDLLGKYLYDTPVGTKAITISVVDSVRKEIKKCAAKNYMTQSAYVQWVIESEMLQDKSYLAIAKLQQERQQQV